MEILGIDIGGSGIKGAPVNLETGELAQPRLRIPTPQPAKPAPMAEVVAEIARHFDWHGPIGCGFPASLHKGVALTAANVHKKWVGTDAARLFSEATGCPAVVINDADAAGLAEMQFGAGRGRMGTLVLVTIGTGLGTALFNDGVLFPNTDLGHIEMNGGDAELQASDAARQRLKLSWKKWARNFNHYLLAMEHLFWPDLFIIGGGTSKKFDEFKPYLTVQAEVVPAQLLNEAGIVGAALAGRVLLEP
jgi:polyphosphate glucokinase